MTEFQERIESGPSDFNEYEDQQVAELEDTDDWATAWQECKELGMKWGGRGMGGRATGRMTVQTKDVVVEGCTMSYLGTNLLERTTLRLLQGHKYGLIGRNGVGKSTLMRRIATGTLPGFPPHLCVAQVKQELPFLNHPDNIDITPVEYCVKFNPIRKMLMDKISEIENGEDEDEELQDPETQANVLCELYGLLEDDNVITGRAVNILKDLGFGEKRRSSPLSKMSGGWKMRASIACALAQEPDILLLDEPTNHLDLEGVEWLVSYLTGPTTQDLTVLVTSHDSHFLDQICTDIIRFAHRQLTPYVGNYSAYESIKHDKDLMNSRVQENVEKQRKHLEDQIRRMQIAAHRDASGKGNGQIASKKKKLARHGYEKNIHGHKFNAQHEATAGRSTMRAGSRNETSLGAKTGNSRCLIEAAEREWEMELPVPNPLSSLAPILQLRNISAGFKNQTQVVNQETKEINRNDNIESRTTTTPPSVASMTATTATTPAASTGASTGGGAATGGSSSLKKVKVLGGSKNAKKAASVPDDQTTGLQDQDITKILDSITLDMDQNTKIAIVGKNGCGKSTLLKLITQYGEHLPVTSNTVHVISGEIFKNPNLKIAYYQQHQADSLPYDLTPLQHLTNIASTFITPGDSETSSNRFNEQAIRAHLGAFGLSGDLALQQIGVLSGGQKSRVVFAELTLQKPHLLLLDEPTNNLDLDAIRALKDAILAFPGACLITSHDTSFISNCNCSVVYHLSNGRLSRLEGGVMEYRQIVQENVKKQRKGRS